MGKESFVMFGRLGSTALVWSTMMSSAKGYPLSRTIKRALMILSRCQSTSAGLMAFPHSPSPPYLACATSNVGSGENVCCFESAAKSMVTVKKTKKFLAADVAVKMAGLSLNIYGPSHKKPNNIASPTPSLSCKSAWTELSTGITRVSIIAACIASVTQSQKNTWRPLLHTLQAAEFVV